MEQNKEVYFHVGIPKTASTFLQYNFFPHINDVCFIKKHHFDRHERIIAETDKKKILLSSEMDIGTPGRYNRLKLIAEKYPDAKIIIVFRRHDSWIKSKYYYNIRKAGAENFNEFFNFEDTGIFTTEGLRCMHRIKVIEELFNSRPLVIFFEELKKDPEKVMEAVSDFMGVTYKKEAVIIKQTNKAFSLDALKAILRFNKRVKFKPDKIRNNFIRSKATKYFGVFNRIIILFVTVFKLYRHDKTELIPTEELEKIRSFYEEDWNDAILYAKQQREVFI